MENLSLSFDTPWRCWILHIHACPHTIFDFVFAHAFRWCTIVRESTHLCATHLTSCSVLHKHELPHPTQYATEKLRSSFKSYSYQVSHSNITAEILREPINRAIRASVTTEASEVASVGLESRSVPLAERTHWSSARDLMR